MSAADWIDGLQLLFQTGPLIGIVVGTLVGLTFGLLPGVGSSTALAIVLALIVYLDPITALVTMVAIYSADSFGGSITGILLNIPGSGAATATAVDGYQMTLQGRAGEAIAAGRSAAFLGSMIGGVVLLLFAPSVAQFALTFGPAEYFALAVFGVVVVAALSPKALTRALIAAMIGFLLATVGSGPSTPFPRFSFGEQNLFSGLNIVWVIVGFFAVSQAFMLASGDTVQPRYDGKIEVPWRRGWAIVGRNKRFLLAGSATGVGIGLIPGGGSTISAWLAYNQAQRLSKHPEKFGKGSVEGVIAAEAASDSVDGASLIPTMALGIPSNASAAIIMGGFLLAGLTPGPRLFEEQAPSALAVMLSFMLAEFAFLVVAIVAMRWIIQILRLPGAAWPPIIMMLAVFGSTVVEQRIYGAYVALAVGALGYLLVRAGFPLVPALLAFILGPLLEDNWVRLTRIAPGDELLGYVLGRPIAVALLSIAVLAMVADVYRRARPRALPSTVVEETSR